jgi:hypothetical protein
MSTYDDPVQGRGGVVFAAAMMIVIGVFQAIEGLVAIFDDDWFVLTRHYTFDLNVTAYGWIHLILGLLILAAGCALFAGRVWAGVLAIFLAILAAIANFFFIPYYPFWSITIIALCVWVIWSVTRPGAVTAT